MQVCGHLAGAAEVVVRDGQRLRIPRPLALDGCQHRRPPQPHPCTRITWHIITGTYVITQHARKCIIQEYLCIHLQTSRSCLHGVHATIRSQICHSTTSPRLTMQKDEQLYAQEKTQKPEVAPVVQKTLQQGRNAYDWRVKCQLLMEGCVQGGACGPMSTVGG